MRMGSAADLPLDRLAKTVSLVGLVVATFLAGMVWTGLELWPYPVLKTAQRAVRAVQLRYFTSNWAVFPAEDARSGTTVLDRGRAFAGFTLISRQGEDGFGARLIDLDGTVVHAWHARFEDVWRAGASHIQRPGNPSFVRWHGLHLFPNGDLLLNLETEHFPYGGGLVKLDRDSRIVWTLARNTHHSVKVMADGTIWATALNHRTEPMAEVPFLRPPFYEDVILEVSPDGRVLDEISIPLALRGAQGLFWNDEDQRDPTHVNDVEPVTEELAPSFPMLAAGDLVVSLRTLNAIVGIDGRSKRAKMVLVGPWIGQHDPDLLPDGSISLFDNRGGPAACGGTRIVKLDPATQRIVWQHDGCRGDRLDSHAWGDHQWLPNGNLLITEPFGGRAFEITGGDEPRLVWEHVNGLGERDGKPVRGLIGEARRFAYDALPFVRRPSAPAG
jgi:hypothetical protein